MVGKAYYCALHVVGGLHELDDMRKTHDVAKDEELVGVRV
jgi:hypothetical protein